jgi:hypothetical protein
MEKRRLEYESCSQTLVTFTLEIVYFILDFYNKLTFSFTDQATLQ